MNTGFNIHDTGVVIKKNIGSYHVRCSGNIVRCSLNTRLRKGLVYSADNPSSKHRAVKAVREMDHVDPVAVGDSVRFDLTGEAEGVIIEVLPRRNRLARQDPAPGSHKFEQVIVANVDYVIPVFAAANPAPKWGLLDRYLVSIENMGIGAMVVITKMDLVDAMDPNDAQDLFAQVDLYRRVGYPVLLTSAYTGMGLDELRRELKGRLSAFVGKSGVGKSALLNALEPGLGLRVGAVGAGRLGKGRHTTTAAEMIPLDFGGDIVDTPGIREFGLSDVEVADLAYSFPEMRPYVGQCRFGLGCRHDEEPGCAIRQAVMAGQIHPHRYRSFLLLQEEL